MAASPKQRPSGHRRPAFTFIELLAVLGVIALLVALLLPAVQSAREAARRTQCGSNLTQLVMAVHQYQAAHGVYPPGTIDRRGPIASVPRGYHHNWLVQILPFLEQQVVYLHIDRQASVYAPVNRSVLTHSLSRVVLCPSDSMARGAGGISYAGVHHDIESPIDRENHGVFFLNRALAPDEIQDGHAYTAFLGEKSLESTDLGWMSGTRTTLRNMGEPVNAGLARARTPGGATWGILSEEQDALRLDDEAMAELAEAMAAELPDSESGTLPAGGAWFVGGFSSLHRGGANFAFGDGHVRLLSNSMDQSIYRQLGHRADGALPANTSGY